MNKAIIDLKALGDNLRAIKKLAPGAGVVTMVKANAYGHGIVAVSQYFISQGVETLGVATLEEAILLRENGITSTILLMSGAGFSKRAELVVKYHITPLVSSKEEILALAKYGPVEIHLDIDTGLGRGGFSVVDNSLIVILKQNPIKVGGIATHFANAESDDCAYSKIQLERFSTILRYFDKQGISYPLIHIAKSSAILHHLSGSEIYPSKRLWIRPGIALYDTVLTWQAPITLRKRIPAGSAVGYNNTWIARRETEIALLRVGYGDGYSRLLSNRAHVLIAGQRAPVVGNVSMDLTAIDVTDIHGEAEFATLIGQDGDEKITSSDLATLSQTIPYEILTSISPRVMREYHA